mgnify:CR=1 FL=1
MARRRILILQHADDERLGASPHRVWDLVPRWERRGFEVLAQRGVEAQPPADVVIPNIDLTVVPEPYRRFLASYPRVINRHAVDVSKRVVSEQLVVRGDGYEGAVVVAKVREMKAEEGFNAQTEKYENLVEAGVIDPTKVVRTALQNASSIASLLLTTEALVSEIPEKKNANAVDAGADMY